MDPELSAHITRVLSEFAFRPAELSDKAGVLAVAPDIFSGLDYMNWQYELLVQCPHYHPWVCESLVTGQIVGFCFGFLSGPGREIHGGGGGTSVSLGGGRTRPEHQNSGLNNALVLHILHEISDGSLSKVSDVLGVYCQPKYLLDTFPEYNRSASQGGGSSVIRGRIVLEHSCLAFELQPSARRSLRASAADDAACSALFRVDHPAALLAAEPVPSASGVGLGLGDVLVLCREVAHCCPETWERLRHWTVSTLASRRDGEALAGVSFANLYACPLGANLVLNVYAADEAAAAAHIVGQLRRFLLLDKQQQQQQQRWPASLDPNATVLVSAYFPVRLRVNDILSRIHLTPWIDKAPPPGLPLCNRPSAFCALRATRTDMSGRQHFATVSSASAARL